MSCRSRGVPVGPHKHALDDNDEDDSSDYGPDFTSDEEELLNTLLGKAGSVTTGEADGAGVITGSGSGSAASRVAVTAAGAEAPREQEKSKSSSASRLVEAPDVDADLDVFVTDIEDQEYVITGLSRSRSTAAFGEGIEEESGYRAGEFSLPFFIFHCIFLYLDALSQVCRLVFN